MTHLCILCKSSFSWFSQGLFCRNCEVQIEEGQRRKILNRRVNKICNVCENENKKVDICRRCGSYYCQDCRRYKEKSFCDFCIIWG